MEPNPYQSEARQTLQQWLLLFAGQRISIATDAEAFAMACCTDSALAALRADAEALADGSTCRADAWNEIVTQLLALDLTAGLYDVAIDGLHDVARMPCRCPQCWARGVAKEEALKTRLLPITSNSTSMNPLIRARYDQEGRYRIRGR